MKNTHTPLLIALALVACQRDDVQPAPSVRGGDPPCSADFVVLADDVLYNTGDERPALDTLALCGSVLTVHTLGCERLVYLVTEELPAPGQDTVSLRLVDPEGPCATYDLYSPATYDLSMVQVPGIDSLVIRVGDAYITWRY